MTDERFPLGKPTNRSEEAALIPIPGRPNWFQPRRGGEPVYREPPKKPEESTPRSAADWWLNSGCM